VHDSSFIFKKGYYMTNPIIDIIIPTYKRKDFLKLVIQSFVVQTYKNWQLSIVIDGKDTESDDLVKSYNNEQISSTMLESGPHNDWGHTAREYGLLNATGDWVLMTGDDNYHMPVFVEYFTNEILRRPDAILHVCNMIAGSTDTQLYKPIRNYFAMDTKLEMGSIDISCFIVKTALAKQIGYPFRAYTADFEFVDAYMKKFGKLGLALSGSTGKLVYTNINKITNFLCVHN
jgi:glycosyltransferase involved in cell wall biosynthesis